LFQGPPALPRDFQRGNSIDFLAKRLLGPLQIESLLQIEPQVRTVSAQFSQPQGHDRCDRLLLLKNRNFRRATLTRSGGNLLKLSPLKTASVVVVVVVSRKLLITGGLYQ